MDELVSMRFMCDENSSVSPVDRDRDIRSTPEVAAEAALLDAETAAAAAAVLLAAAVAT